MIKTIISNFDYFALKYAETDKIDDIKDESEEY